MIPDRVFELDPARVPAAEVVLVVEIVSLGSRGTDHVMKLHEYAKAGIQNYWIVDPDAPPHDRFLAYRLDGDIYRRSPALDGDTVRVNEPTAMEFALDALTGRYRNHGSDGFPRGPLLRCGQQADPRSLRARLARSCGTDVLQQTAPLARTRRRSRR